MPHDPLPWEGVKSIAQRRRRQQTAMRWVRYFLRLVLSFNAGAATMMAVSPHPSAPWWALAVWSALGCLAMIRRRP